VSVIRLICDDRRHINPKPRRITVFEKSPPLGEWREAPGATTGRRREQREWYPRGAVPARAGFDEWLKSFYPGDDAKSGTYEIADGRPLPAVAPGIAAAVRAALQRGEEFDLNCLPEPVPTRRKFECTCSAPCSEPGPRFCPRNIRIYWDDLRAALDLVAATRGAGPITLRELAATIEGTASGSSPPVDGQ
jgi:hypothetical protein